MKLLSDHSKGPKEHKKKQQNPIERDPEQTCALLNAPDSGPFRVNVRRSIFSHETTNMETMSFKLLFSSGEQPSIGLMIQTAFSASTVLTLIDLISRMELR